MRNFLTAKLVWHYVLIMGSETQDANVDGEKRVTKQMESVQLGERQQEIVLIMHVHWKELYSTLPKYAFMLQ